jgi:hypothetical protein
MIIHTPKSFCQYGWKQLSTWIGLVLLAMFFVCIFYQDLHTLVHNVLTSNSLSEKIITGLGGAVFIAFNRFNGKNDKDNSNDNQSPAE